jgi:hypothetical protein
MCDSPTLYLYNIYIYIYSLRGMLSEVRSIPVVFVCVCVCVCVSECAHIYI